MSFPFVRMMSRKYFSTARRGVLPNRRNIPRIEIFPKEPTGDALIYDGVFTPNRLVYVEPHNSRYLETLDDDIKGLPNTMSMAIAVKI